MKKNMNSKYGVSGFTIVEIIVGVIIIGILTLIMVPVLTSRAEEAKISAATSDLERLADAQERAALQTGFMYRIYALDDAKGGDRAIPPAFNTIPAVPPLTDSIDGIRDNDIAAANPYVNPTKIFIRLDSLDYDTNFPTIFSRLLVGNDADHNGDIGERNFNWNGPYINWGRDINKNDWPDDPWGNDYLFFTRKGVIYPPVRLADGTTVADTSDQFTNTYVTHASDGSTRTFTFAIDPTPLFDRPTFLSLGPNGLPGDGANPAGVDTVFGRGDDIIRSFSSAN